MIQFGSFKCRAGVPLCCSKTFVLPVWICYILGLIFVFGPMATGSMAAQLRLVFGAAPVYRRAADVEGQQILPADKS